MNFVINSSLFVDINNRKVYKRKNLSILMANHIDSVIEEMRHYRSKLENVSEYYTENPERLLVEKNRDHFLRFIKQLSVSMEIPRQAKIDISKEERALSDSYSLFHYMAVMENSYY